MEQKQDDWAQAMQRIYYDEARILTPEADALFTTNGTYSALEKTALDHKAYFARTASTLGKAMRTAKNEGVHIGISAAVGGIFGLFEGLYRRDIINCVARGIKYGTALGAASRGFKHIANRAGPRIAKAAEIDEDLTDLLAIDTDFAKDPRDFLRAYSRINQDAAKDPAQLGRIYTLFGIENRFVPAEEAPYNSFKKEEADMTFRGGSYAVLALVVNNIIRRDFLDLQVASGMGVLTAFVEKAAKDVYTIRMGNHAKKAVQPVIADMDRHTRRQVIGGLVNRWYGKP